MRQEKPVSNWFDVSTYDESCYSVFDKLGEIREHPKAGAVINQLDGAGRSEPGRCGGSSQR